MAGDGQADIDHVHVVAMDQGVIVVGDVGNVMSCGEGLGLGPVAGRHGGDRDVVSRLGWDDDRRGRNTRRAEKSDPKRFAHVDPPWLETAANLPGGRKG